MMVMVVGIRESVGAAVVLGDEARFECGHVDVVDGVDVAVSAGAITVGEMYASVVRSFVESFESQREE